MKRIVLLAFVVIVGLAGCSGVWDFITGFLPEEYDAIVGTWLVDLTTRPEGWLDYKYIFGEDRSFEIRYYEDGAEAIQYTGTVSSFGEEDMVIKKESSRNPDDAARMIMVYQFDSENALRLGWYDDAGAPVYYLTLNRVD
jgi:hypothetical protein